ncbi:MAG: hypothetical protein Q7V19_00335, partial [Bacteroidales bacterium]|nr:hypothetical protein [Bacteroidales bacterium]
MKNIDQLKKVMRSHLCNRCGSCVGLSDGAVVFEDKTGDYRPVIKAEIDEKTAKTLWEACPGKNFNFPSFREEFYPDAPNFNTFIGPYRQIGIGFAVNPVIR